MPTTTTTPAPDVATLRTWTGQLWEGNAYCPGCGCRKNGYGDNANAIDEGCSADGTCRCHDECAECGTRGQGGICNDCWATGHCQHDQTEEVVDGDRVVRGMVYCVGCERTYYDTPDGLEAA